MDDPTLDAAEHRRALVGLRRINAWSRTAHYLACEVREVVRQRKLTKLRVLDVACGGGDNLRQLSAKFANGNCHVEWIGCDISPTAIDQARRGALRSKSTNCRFLVHDVFTSPPPERYDIVMSTLFLHHLSHDLAVKLLRTMSAVANHAVLVDDLVRSRRGYWLAQLGCHFLSRSPIVQSDGPQSVRSAFTLDEVGRLASEAELRGATLREHWPERFTLCWQIDS
jgi:2-polyprenyl-3-methyl-5-hydroxy-6-metoxy-1,4-benzoquinol methylase